MSFDDHLKEVAVPDPAAAEDVPDLRGSRSCRLAAEYARDMKAQGEVLRLATGLPTLDAIFRGGLPVSRFVVLGGAPGAGKTTLLAYLAMRFAKAGSPVVFLAVDEGGEGLVERWAAMDGYPRDCIDRRDEDALESHAKELDQLPLYVFDAITSGEGVESAAEQLARVASVEHPGVLLVDSIQTAAAEGSSRADNERARINCVVSALKRATQEHGFLTIATSELNRGSYRSQDAAQQCNDLAAFKESGGIEYAAQSAFVLRSVKGAANIVDVSVPKNRGYAKKPFRLQLDPILMTYREVEVSAEPDAPDTVSLLRGDIIDLIAKNHDLTSKNAICARLRRGNKTTRLQAIAELVERELIGQVDGSWRLTSEIEP